MACSAVALSAVTALRLPPHKLSQLLDPLTLRLLSRLRPQQNAPSAAALLAEGPMAVRRAAAADEHRSTALVSTYGAGLLESAEGGVQDRTRSPSHGRGGKGVPWTLQRGDGGRSDAAAAPGGGAHQVAWAGTGRARTRSTSPPVTRGRSPDASWEEASLPRGLTESMADRLPFHSESVRQLVSVIAEVESARRRTSGSRSIQQAQQQPRAGLVALSCSRQPATTAAPAGGDYGGCSQLDGLGAHTDVLESVCLGIIDLLLVEGQPPAAAEEEDAVAVAIDDSVASFVGVVHDAGLRLVRWGPGRYILIAELPVEVDDDENESGCDGDEGGGGGGGGVITRRAGARAAANCLLSMRRRLANVVAKAPCPHLRFCAGLATGSCFLESVGASSCFVICHLRNCPLSRPQFAHLPTDQPTKPTNHPQVVTLSKPFPAAPFRPPLTW
jgi:hypothetical protein